MAMKKLVSSRLRAGWHGVRGHVRRQVEQAAVREYQVSGKNLYLTLAAGPSLDDIFGADRDAFGDACSLQVTLRIDR